MSWYVCICDYSIICLFTFPFTLQFLSTLSKKSCPEKAQPFLFTYLLTAHRDDRQKWRLAALSLAQSPFPVGLQSISNPTESGRKNGTVKLIVKLSIYFIMDELDVIFNQFFFFFFASCLVTDDKRILPALRTQGREGTEQTCVTRQLKILIQNL